MCKSKQKGGLGLDNLQTRNTSLLFKWWYKWFSERQGYWWRILKQKYQLLSHQGLNQCGSMEGMSYIMRDICNPHNSHHWINSFNEQAHSWILENGDNILFWEDSWFEGIALALKYPRLYSISNLQQQSVNVVISRWSNRNSTRWTRELRAWEMEVELELTAIIDNLVLGNSKDLVIWNTSKNFFSARDCYRYLEGLNNTWERNWKKV